MVKRMTRTGRSLTGAMLLASACLGRAAAPVQETRATVREWIALKEARANERRAWNEERAMLRDRQEVLTREAERLEARLAVDRTALDGENEEHRALQGEAQLLERAWQDLAERLPDLERRLSAWRPLLPAALDRKLAPSYVTLASDALAPVERIQAGLTILTALHDVNRAPSAGRLPHPFPEDGPAEVAVLYAGFGQAWYVGPDDAGFGFPTQDGWRWQRRSELRDAIAKALQMQGAMVGGRVAVDLPVVLHEGAGHD